MQFPHKTKQFWSLAVKLLVVSLSFIVIFRAVYEVDNSQWQLIYDFSKFSSLLWVGFFLSLLNWSLEGLKWRTLLSDFKVIKFSIAFSETLRAHAVSIITPNKIGEFGAKASFYSKSIRPEILKLTLTGQLYQLATTCLFGSIGVTVIYTQLSFKLKLYIGIALGILFGVSLIVYALKFKNKWLTRLNLYLISITKISDIKNAKVLLLSILRYVCFSHQFYLLMWIFQPELNYVQVMPIIFSIYFISSFVPTFLILDATVKAGFGLVLLQNHLSSEFIILVSFLMWIFNFGIPALFGNLLLLTPRRISFHSKKVL
ncbi:flippase-like domain-containing protein [Psychroflexus sp. CAK8W]|uniref:Flippase-like domain-containing protein n=1 Tax=Psychroflexus longus TaxID=2873596 RepID=A0ABS7XEK6_9FLAO|nr:flippase-like domain-containing protein [Psychroflexus longus]MBZ9777373.1 flippase-like domain-containing protein [Psychroflexus longus]